MERLGRGDFDMDRIGRWMVRYEICRYGICGLKGWDELGGCLFLEWKRELDGDSLR